MLKLHSASSSFSFSWSLFLMMSLLLSAIILLCFSWSRSYSAISSRLFKTALLFRGAMWFWEYIRACTCCQHEDQFLAVWGAPCLPCPCCCHHLLMFHLQSLCTHAQQPMQRFSTWGCPSCWQIHFLIVVFWHLPSTVFVFQTVSMKWLTVSG